MKITRQELLSNGYAEHITKNGVFYVKGTMALVYVYNVWMPCYYAAGTQLSDRIYVETMEELDLLNH